MNIILIIIIYIFKVYKKNCFEENNPISLSTNSIVTFYYYTEVDTSKDAIILPRLQNKSKSIIIDVGRFRIIYQTFLNSRDLLNYLIKSGYRLDGGYKPRLEHVEVWIRNYIENPSYK